MSIVMIGLDTAKASFQVHGINEQGCAEIRRKLRRSEVIGFFEAQPACTVVLEACGSAHHWGRVLSGLGHTVKLVAPEAVRPFVKRGRKNDAADAAALCEAARRPEIKFVPVKSPEQQATLALHSARALLVKQQIMLANAMRSLGAEFGLVVLQGLGRLGELATLMGADAGVPETADQALRALHQQFRAAREAAAGLEAALVAHARQDETARRLATIVANGNDPVPQGTDRARTRSAGPGVGPITASLIAATVTDIGLFKSARHFAAPSALPRAAPIPAGPDRCLWHRWLGLVPRQHSTGGKARLGRITKAGNPEIRKFLVLGATSMVRRAGQWNGAPGAWIRGVLARRPARLATVALANKTARIIWALTTRKESYRPHGHAAAVATA